MIQDELSRTLTSPKRQRGRAIIPPPPALALRACCACLFVFVLPCHLLAHPVPRDCHDRVVVVRPTADALIVEYHLELDELTLLHRDLKPFIDEGQLDKVRSREEFHEAFTRIYAPILADNLLGTLDGQDLTFTCINGSHKLTDSVQCDFVFRAPWKLAAGKAQRFTFRDINWQLDGGRIDLSLAGHAAVEMLACKEPDVALRKALPIDMRPGDEDRLREASGSIRLRWAPVETPAIPAASSPLRPQTTTSPWPMLLILVLGLAAVLAIACVLVRVRGRLVSSRAAAQSRMD